MVDTKRLLASAAIAAVLTLGAGTAVIAQQGALTGDENEAAEAQDSDESLTGQAARRVEDAALRAADGAVLEVEKGDDSGAAYEVEVRKADGGVVEVLLDGDFKVVGQETGD